MSYYFCNDDCLMAEVDKKRGKLAPPITPINDGAVGVPPNTKRIRLKSKYK